MRAGPLSMCLVRWRDSAYRHLGHPRWFGWWTSQRCHPPKPYK